MNLVYFSNNQNDFPIILDGKEMFFKDLDDDFQRVLSKHALLVNIIYDDNNISDDDRLQWFKFLNFSGTQMDKDHLEQFK